MFEWPMSCSCIEDWDGTIPFQWPKLSESQAPDHQKPLWFCFHLPKSSLSPLGYLWFPEGRVSLVIEDQASPLPGMSLPLVLSDSKLCFPEGSRSDLGLHKQLNKFYSSSFFEHFRGWFINTISLSKWNNQHRIKLLSYENRGQMEVQCFKLNRQNISFIPNWLFLSWKWMFNQLRHWRCGESCECI